MKEFEDPDLGKFVFDELWDGSIDIPELNEEVLVQFETEGSTLPSHTQLNECKKLVTSIPELVTEIKTRLFHYYESIPESEKKLFRFPELAFPPISNKDEVWKIFSEPGIFVPKTLQTDGIQLEWRTEWDPNNPLSMKFINCKIVNLEVYKSDA